MRFCCLGSGSRGNAFVVEHGNTTVLIDCGFSGAGLVRRLARRFLDVAEINAVLVTHEHRDHISGLCKLLAASKAEVHMTSGTAQALCMERNWRRIEPGRPFTLGDLHVSPVTVPHDANEPVQFVFDDGERQLGIFTDLGHVTPAIHNACRKLRALIVECNYSARLLAANTRYPAHIKKRIAGAYGHLENAGAAALVAHIGGGRLQHIVAAHLSANNNTAALAHEALAAVCPGNKITVATQNNGTEWMTINA